MDKEFNIGAGPQKGKKVIVHVPTGNNAIKLIHSIADEILQTIISPITEIQGAWADMYLSYLADYNLPDKSEKRTKVLDQIAEKYNINRAILEGYQDAPLVVFALLALEKQ